MYYISPFRSLGIEDFDVIDKNALNLAKKKLLAELELSPTNTIKKGQNELTKDAVIKAFDNLSQMGIWEMHRAIAKDSTLLAFLENQTFSKSTVFSNNELYIDRTFIDFVSPYFSNSYKKNLWDLLKKNDYALLEKLVKNTPKLMSEGDIYETNAILESWISAKIEEIEDIIEQMENGTRFSNKEIDHLFNIEWIRCLNKLPADFSDIKDSYIIALYNLSGGFWNLSLHKNAKKILNNALVLKGSAYERDLLFERQQFYQESDTNTLIMLFWRMYNMAIFQKPEGITLAISWILKIIAAPFALPFKAWERFSESIGHSKISKFVTPVGNAILSYWCAIYAIWFFFGSILAISSVFDQLTSKYEGATYSEIIPILKNLDDSIDYYQDRMNGMKFETAEEGSQLRLTYDTLTKRRAIYQTAFNRFYEIEDSLRTFNWLSEKQKNKNSGEWLKKGSILKDSIGIYRLKLDPIAKHYSFLLLFVNSADVRTKKGELDTVATKQLKKDIEIAKDSIRFYDKILENMQNPK